VIKTGAFFFFVFGVLALLGTFAQINPIWQVGPYTPVAISAGSQPDFYMGFLEGSLRIFPNWTWDIGGHTIAWNVFIPALVILGFLFTVLGVWPFLERWATGDKAYHNVNQRPRNAPTRTGVGMAGVVFYGVMWLEGANDLIADHLQIPLYTTTEIARYAVFIGPVITFWLTRRICIGLQRRDAAMLEHGVETGIIQQLPNGGFVEAERPVTPEEAAALIELPPPSVTEVRSDTDENGLPSPSRRGLAGRVQARAHDYFVEGISLAPPTNGHTNGHGTNGHGTNGHNGHNGHAVEGGERAAVGSGQSDDRQPDDEA
jgi:ubiquinol-cytochrome c reductase cytochrome b subunit